MNIFRKNKNKIGLFDKHTNFISQALKVGVAKLDNPTACSGQIVWNDGSKIDFENPNLENFIEKHGSDWTKEELENDLY